MKTKLFFLFLSIVFILASCDKDPTKKGYQRKPPKPEFYRLPMGEAKNYLWAKPGSYWIYKNTLTGDLDTQTVTSFRFDSVTMKGTLEYRKHITIEYERLKRSVFSTYNKWYYNDQTSKYSADDTRELQTVLDRFGGGNTNMPFFHPFIYNNGNQSTPILKSFDSSFILQGKTYLSVARFDIDIDGIDEGKLSCYNPVTSYYWAKNVGLIKKEMKSCSYSWELVDYKIIK